MNTILAEIQEEIEKIPSNINKAKIIKKKYISGPNGIIKELSVGKNKKKYVLKIVKFNKTTEKFDKYRFKNEIKIGQNKNIDKFGIKIHHYKIKEKYGWYIMDHIQKKYQNAFVYTLYQYFNMFNNKRIPDNHTIYSLLYNKLNSFYKYTKGYHGDLHTKNIAVILKNEKSTESKDLLNILIYDYSTFVPFKNVLKNASLINYLLLSKKEFNKNKNMSFYKIYNINVPMKKHEKYGKQLIRSNHDVLFKQSYLMYGYPKYFIHKMLNEITKIKSG